MIEATLIGTHSEAIAQGYRYYRSGRLCRQQHESNRYTSSGDCVVCATAKARRNYRLNEDREKARERDRYHADVVASRERHRLHRINNLDAYKERDRQRYPREKAARLALWHEWRRRNPDKVREIRRRAAKKHRVKNNARTAARRAISALATPSWLSAEHLVEIKQFYVEAALLSDTTGIKHHVDHIFPLRGKHACGLNVPWNLQVLTATANLRKRNEMPELEIAS